MTDKELRTLDEMLTNLEIWSTWNKTFANEMIGICSKMRNLLADRKTEPKPSCQRCKHWNGNDGCDVMTSATAKCKYEPQTERKSCETCRWEPEEWEDEHCASCVAHSSYDCAWK